MGSAVPADTFEGGCSMTATLSDDRQFVTLQGALWSEIFPVADLRAKLQFYRSLAERGGKGKGHLGPFAQHYAATIEALLTVLKEVSA